MSRHLLLALFFCLLLQVFAQEVIKGEAVNADEESDSPLNCNGKIVTLVKETPHSYQMCRHMQRHQTEWENDPDTKEYLPEDLKDYTYQQVWQSCLCLGKKKEAGMKKKNPKFWLKAKFRGRRPIFRFAPKIVEAATTTDTVHVTQTVRLVEATTETATATASATVAPKCYAPRDYCDIDQPGECCNEECKFAERNSLGDPVYRCA